MAIDLKEFRRRTWRLHPELDVRGLQPPVVLFSVFAADPRPKFKELLQAAAGIPDAAARETVTGLDPQLVQHGRLKGMWDSLFREIPGNRISFLYQNARPKRSTKSKPSKAGRIAVQTVTMLASNEAPGTKWLVTRAILYNRRTVCWCIPVTVTMGKASKVRLTSRNMMELDAD